MVATGAELRTDDVKERVAQRFLRWYSDDPPDVGVQTRAVLAETLRRGGPAAATLRKVSADLQPGRSWHVCRVWPGLDDRGKRACAAGL